MATKSFIKTIGSKGLLADYNTEGKKLQTQMTAGDNITIGGDTISSNQVFVAIAWTTTYAEVKAAYDAGKICTVRNGNNYYYLTQINSNVIWFVSPIPNPNLVSLKLTSNDKWESYSPWLQTHLTFDTTPTAGSKNPVTSDGIKTAIDTVNEKGITVKKISGEQVICFE